MTNSSTSAPVKTFRELAIARNVKYAVDNKLNPEAVEYARKYIGMTPVTLTLVSNFYNALDLPHGPSREHDIRACIDAVIRYIRTLPNKEDDEAA